MEKDWDNLIILDACRYDMFEAKYNDLGNLSKVISGGSNTSEFLIHNFSSEPYSDTVLVTANPQYQNNQVEDRFFSVELLWESEWDERLETVPPEKAIKAAVHAIEEYPDKRVICHLLQPHYPFIGPAGRKIEHRSVTGGGVIEATGEFESIWKMLEDGNINKQSVYTAYDENLDLAMDVIQEYLSELVGKTVITSDHGNAFGEFGIYGHPGKKFLDVLVEVPWLEIEGDKRRRITVGTNTQSREHDQQLVEDRLKKLGYMN
jgi:hypothetical protein